MGLVLISDAPSQTDLNGIIFVNLLGVMMVLTQGAAFAVVYLFKRRPDGGRRASRSLRCHT